MLSKGKPIWAIGLVLLAVGEFLTAFNATKGDTISEFYWGLPGPARAFILVALGAVLGHWEWPKPPVTA